MHDAITTTLLIVTCNTDIAPDNAILLAMATFHLPSKLSGGA